MTTIKTSKFGKTKAGQTVTAFDLSNGKGMRVRVLDLGGTIQSLFVPDRNGAPTDVVLGYDTVEGYENGSCYYGAVVGRCTNRIGNARFTLDGKEYKLQKTPGEENHVHGVFNKKLFRASLSGGSLTLSYRSPSMEEGFPGNVDLKVCYTLSDDDALEISYEAVTDAPTVLNVTNHSYFNLNGQDGSTIFDHKLSLNSSSYTEYTPSFAQTGRIIPVEGTPLDFRTEHTIGERFGDDYPQLRLCTGYDHNMVLDGKEGEFKPIGTLKSEKTGICLEAFTTEPAVHFYSGNYMHLDSAPNEKKGVHFPKNGAVCLEAQHHPDAINHPNFPSTVLRPGEIYRQRTVYRFKTV